MFRIIFTMIFVVMVGLFLMGMQLIKLDVTVEQIPQPDGGVCSWVLTTVRSPDAFISQNSIARHVNHYTCTNKAGSVVNEGWTYVVEDLRSER